MNLVEAPDHAGPAAPPHAPERLRTLLAEGRDAQNDETAQSERAGFSPLKLNLDSYSESKDSNIFALGWSLWRGGSPSLVVFYSPLLGVSLSLVFPLLFSGLSLYCSWMLVLC